MIKFFRKIRQKLIEQSKVRSYFIYAIGEIVLVVIGILIALQINNWNEHKKERARERELLTYALENIKTDSLSIDSIMAKTDKIIKVHQNLIKISKGKLSTQEAGNLDLIRASEPNLTITKKNNPNLPSEVKDQQLKKNILEYYLTTDWLEFTIINNNELIEKKVRPFLGEKRLLNYGNQLEEDLRLLDLIHDEKFFEEFQKEELRQILFESGLKLRIMRVNAERTLKKNVHLKGVITNYINQR